MDEELAATIIGCVAAHRRLEATMASIDNEAVARPSRLPGWTVGHVLTHLARNAASHVHMFEAAAAGRAVEQYPGGYEQRSRDIEGEATRSADELRADVRGTSAVGRGGQPRVELSPWEDHYRSVPAARHADPPPHPLPQA